MTSPEDYLSEWLIRYLKNKDLMLHKIKELNHSGNLVISVEKTGTKHYVVVPFITTYSEALIDIDSDQITLVVYNTQNNISQLIKEWKPLLNQKRFMVFFVNPFSQQDKRWIICPRTHDMISDEKNLKEGIESLALSVDKITKEELLEIIS